RPISTSSKECKEEAMNVPYVLAIDAGTTGVRCRAVFADGRDGPAAYREFTQYFPHPGWVEHDPSEIWSAVVTTFRELTDHLGLPQCIGITNQRETVLAWNRVTGESYGKAIVWQDRRTADDCSRLESEGHLDRVRSTTGLVLDPYFSGTKMAWILEAVRSDIGSIPDDLILGTIDSWILWNLTAGDVFATDPSNASRTMLYDIAQRAWSDELSSVLRVPLNRLADVRPSSGSFGSTSHEALPTGIPITGIAGDQQAALFGQACFSPGMAKNTYGTGSFVLMNIGQNCPAVRSGLLTTIAWSLLAAEGPVETT
ncbi:MAG: FGGY family carbohydrate kinase, partial [Actinomycetota bacterium]